MFITSGELNHRPYLREFYTKYPGTMPPYNVIERDDNAEQDEGTRNMVLSVGDVVFASNTNLYVVVELKTISDMYNSIIKGNRALSQKLRMRGTGVRSSQLIWMILVNSIEEYYSNNHVSETVRNYMDSVSIADGMKVEILTEALLPLRLRELYTWLNRPKRFAGPDPQVKERSEHQAEFFSGMEEAIRKMDKIPEWQVDALDIFMSFLPEELKGAWIEHGGQPYGFGPATKERAAEFAETHSFTAAIPTSNKSHLAGSTVAKTAAMLKQFPGISSNTADEIARRWPTFTHLLLSYEMLVSHAARIGMIAKYVDGIGAKRSEDIYLHMVPMHMRTALMKRDAIMDTANDAGRRSMKASALKIEEHAYKCLEELVAKLETDISEDAVKLVERRTEMLALLFGEKEGEDEEGGGGGSGKKKSKKRKTIVLSQDE
jgi:ERCC4-type nuclease